MYQNIDITAQNKLTEMGMYTQLQKKVYTFRFVVYSRGIGPGINLGGAQPVKLDFKGSFLLSTRKITKCIHNVLSFGVECISDRKLGHHPNLKVLAVPHLLHMQTF